METFAEDIDRLKESFLCAAAQSGNTDDCKALIEIGADINWRSPSGDTPLLAACRRGHHSTMRLLLSHGADSNITDKESYAPIHICAMRNDVNSLDCLLDANTNTVLRTKDGLTALDIAKNKNNESVYNQLMHQRRFGANNNSTTPSTRSNHLLHSLTNALDDLQLSTNTTTTDTSTTATTSNVPSSSTSGRDRLRSRVRRNSNTRDTSSTSGNSTSNTLTNDLSSASVDTTSRSLTSSNARRRQQQQQSPVSKLLPTTSILTNKSATTKTSTAAATHNTELASFSILLDETNKDSNHSTLDSSSSTLLPLDIREEVELLKVMVEEERLSRKQAESRLEVFVQQNKQLLEEFYSMTSQLQSLEERNSELLIQCNKYAGEEEEVGTITSIEECERLEKTLKNTLQVIEVHKSKLIKQQIEVSKEQRLCVICQEQEKAVVLLPCRHMCLCETCANHDALEMCPLCREVIVHKISVYS